MQSATGMIVECSEPPVNFMDGAWHPLSVAKRSMDNGKCILFERVDARYVGPNAGTGVGGGYWEYRSRKTGEIYGRKTISR
jgi:hypothetical protein